MIGHALRQAVPLYGRWLMHQQLDGVWAQGLDRAREVAAGEPVIFASNHVCWWDGILMLTLAPRLRVQNRFLVDATSVEELGFLEHLGAIPIDRRTVVSMIDGMERAAAWADRPRRSVWVYPQGRYRPAHLRPLELHRGITVLQKLTGAAVIPVTMQLNWFLAHLPACAMTFGEPLRGRDDLMGRLESAMLSQLDEQDAWFDREQHGPPFEPVIPTGIVPIHDRVASRVAMGMQRTWRAALRRS